MHSLLNLLTFCSVFFAISGIIILSLAAAHGKAREFAGTAASIVAVSVTFGGLAMMMREEPAKVTRTSFDCAYRICGFEPHEPGDRHHAALDESAETDI